MGHVALCGPAIETDEAGRKIHAFQTRESEFGERVQAIAASAKELNEEETLRPRAEGALETSESPLEAFQIACRLLPKHHRAICSGRAKTGVRHLRLLTL